MMPSLSFPVSLSSSISSYPSAMLHSFFFSEGGSGRAVVDEDSVDGGLISMIIFWPVCLGWTNGRGVGFDRLGPIELPLGVGRWSRLLAGVGRRPRLLAWGGRAYGWYPRSDMGRGGGGCLKSSTSSMCCLLRMARWA